MKEVFGLIKNKLIVGELYDVKINDNIYQLYYLEQGESYDHSCDCCGKDTMNAFIFCEKFYGIAGDDYVKSWESGVYFIGGTSCLKRFVTLAGV